MASFNSQLFEYASRNVTAKDIADYCPSDAGYADYVQEFTAILASGAVPEASNFDINETIGLTRWSDAEGMMDPVRFRWFRTWANAVGVSIACGPEGPGDYFVPNYLAISLLEDAHLLQDLSLLKLLPAVFDELHQRTIQVEYMAEESPFLLLAQLVLALQGHAPEADISCLAQRLMSEADQYSGRVSHNFLWGCTYFDQLHHRWKHFVDLSFPRDGASLTLGALRDALLV